MKPLGFLATMAGVMKAIFALPNTIMTDLGIVGDPGVRNKSESTIFEMLDPADAVDSGALTYDMPALDNMRVTSIDNTAWPQLRSMDDDYYTRHDVSAVKSMTLRAKAMLAGMSSTTWQPAPMRANC